MRHELQQLVAERAGSVDARAQPTAQCAVILTVAEGSVSLNACLSSVLDSAQWIGAKGVGAEVYVVVNGSDTRSAQVAAAVPCHLLTTDDASMAEMRVTGARAAVSAGATWLAFTDATGLVAESWLADQLEYQSDLVVGNVEVTNRFLAIDDAASHDVNVFQSGASLDFANFGLSAHAFALLSQLAADRRTLLDASSARTLCGLGVAIHYCAKPLVYRRTSCANPGAMGAARSDAPWTRL